MTPRSWTAGLALAALMGATSARAEEAVATASATPAPAAELSTAAQIDQFIRSAPLPSLEDEGVDGITPGEGKRQAHGEVGIAVGTGGYRSAYAMSLIPIGETGTLAIAVSESRNDRFGGYGYGGYGGYGAGDRQSIGLSYSSSGAATDPESSCVGRRGPSWHDGRGQGACALGAPPLDPR
ncbi:MAG: hypothetical protein V4597_14395 [Pseudomonadota bacterium]